MASIFLTSNIENDNFPAEKKMCKSVDSYLNNVMFFYNLK